MISTRIQRSLWLYAALASIRLLAADGTGPALQFLEDRFELPSGFRIYRAARPELTGGSYDLAFDGEGRLLVGDGTAVRRLQDRDGDGVFDHYEIIATGLGWRGPQGLLVYGDRLYAVGGDGIQLYEGYRSSGPLAHRGRIGNRFGTGGDHDAHTILRGPDGYLYFMSGNGAGNEDRRHITETNSPVLFEREATVFRISPDGKHWESIGAGGRNPPNLGINYLGDLFSLDSDMEWHVDLPWYRPVTLNQWIVGGDQGWQDVGAYPRYHLDCLPGLLEIGRGSPNWGLFYEHRQFPQKYHDAYFVCDYRWKLASADTYHNTGRLLAFFLERTGASWNASLEVLARPRPGAQDADGRPINFALVDLEVAPDGSLFLSDHNQGLWRILYDPETGFSSRNPPPIAPAPASLPRDRRQLLEELLTLPQPASEWTRLREESIQSALGQDWEAQLRTATLDTRLALAKRLRAIRLLAPNFVGLPVEFLNRLAADEAVEMRGQAAWLFGLRSQRDEARTLRTLLADRDAFVRRRAAEAFTRFNSDLAIPDLIERLSDDHRIVRYVAMAALAHFPPERWLDTASAKTEPQTALRALVACQMRREEPPQAVLQGVVERLVQRKNLTREDRLDLLRVLGLFQSALENPTRPLTRPSGTLSPVGGTGDESRLKSAGRSVLAEPSNEQSLKRFAARRDGLALPTELLNSMAVPAGGEGETQLITPSRGSIPVRAVPANSKIDGRIAEFLLTGFPDPDQDVRWEQARLLGSYRVARAFPKFLAALQTETNFVTQFHIAQSLAKLPSGWNADEEERAVQWLLGTQTGWFAEFPSKGVEFPFFWSSVLAEFGEHHREALLRAQPKIRLGSLLGSTVIDLLAASPRAVESLTDLYRQNRAWDARRKIIAALRKTRTPEATAFLRNEYARGGEPEVRGALLQGLAAQAPHPANEPLLRDGLQHKDPDVVQACARALIPLAPALDENLANLLLSRLLERRESFPALEAALTGLSKTSRPDSAAEESRRRPSEAAFNSASAFWKEWYQRQFGHAYAPRFQAQRAEKSDEEVLDFILRTSFSQGSSVRGAKVFEQLQCNTCHGGGVTPGQEGRLFGPDLAGATRRLTRAELAEALVYPSKQVADRFKAVEIQRRGDEPLTGFITEQTDQMVVLVDREQVHRLPRARIQSITPQAKSLMPERLLNQLTSDQLQDLLAFLDQMGASPAPTPAAK